MKSQRKLIICLGFVAILAIAGFGCKEDVPIVSPAPSAGKPLDQLMAPGEIFAKRVSKNGLWLAYAEASAAAAPTMILQRETKKWTFTSIYPVGFSPDAEVLVVCGHYGDKLPESIAIMKLDDHPSIVRLGSGTIPFVPCPTSDDVMAWSGRYAGYDTAVMEHGRSVAKHYEFNIDTLEVSDAGRQ